MPYVVLCPPQLLREELKECYVKKGVNSSYMCKEVSPRPHPPLPTAHRDPFFPSRRPDGWLAAPRTAARPAAAAQIAEQYLESIKDYRTFKVNHAG